MPNKFLPYMPYSFVPLAHEAGRTRANIRTNKLKTRLEAPVWHHGVNSNQNELFTGELRCTLTTKTPLLVGNEHVSFGQLGTELQRDTNKARTQYLGDFYPVIDPNKANEKTIIYPLRLTDGVHNPILIPGESLKGAFRHVLGSLMSTPLERVSEATFSFRPNMNVSAINNSRTIPIAAEVVKSDSDNLLLEIRPIFDFDLCFVHGADAYTQLKNSGVRLPNGSYSIGSLCPKDTDQFLWHVINSGDGHKRRSRVKKGRAPYGKGEGLWDFGINEKCKLFRYQYGIDPANVLMEGFDPKKTAIAHPGVLVLKQYIADYSIVIPAGIVSQYKATQAHVIDRTTGHLSRHPQNTSKVDKMMEPIQAGDLIFCEMLLPTGVTRQHALALAADPSATVKIKNEAAILSFGHNFRYRWKSADSVCNVLADFDVTAKEWKVSRRPETTACADEKPEEKPDGNRKPEKLSAERRMHGFVTQKGNEAFGDLKQLKDPFNRLAGRVSFNFAMEDVSPEATEADRFVAASAIGNIDKLPDHVVFLQPLAAGKYFFKSYVPQDGGEQSNTWGDGIRIGANNLPEVQSSTLAFSGRKHYPHQLGNLTELPRCHFDMAAVLSCVPQTNGIRSEYAQKWPEFVTSNQASAARYISKEGTKFDYVVRYKDLDSVELGALLACIDPQGFANWLREDAEHKLVETKRWLVKNPNATFALKLGHGRPLGMGSVVNNIDQIVSWDDEKPVDEQQKNKCFEELCEHLDDAVVKQWLQVLQLNRAKPPKSYLLAHIDGGETLLNLVGKIKTAHIQAARTNPVFG